MIAILAAVFFIPLPHSGDGHHGDPAARGRSRLRQRHRGRLPDRARRQGRQRRSSRASGWPCWRTRTWTWKSPSSRPRKRSTRSGSTTCGRLDHSDRKSPETIPQLEKALESVRKQRQEEEADRDRLMLTAARDGTVLPPPPTPATHQEEIEGGQLPSWSGTPLDEESYRPFLKEGVLFCLVGDPRNLEAVLVIDQGDIDFVQDGPGGRSEVRRLAPRHAARQDRADLGFQLEDHAPAAIHHGQGRVGQQDRSGDRRGDAAKRVLPGHRADQRRRRRDARRPPRPGQDPHRAALARRPALAVDHEHLQLPACRDGASKPTFGGPAVKAKRRNPAVNPDHS